MIYKYSSISDLRAKPPGLVFAVHSHDSDGVNFFFSAGAHRLPVDLAFVISRSFAMDPVFIQPDDASEVAQKKLGFVVGVNPDRGLIGRLRPISNALTIGVSGYNTYANSDCDIYLNPCFNDQGRPKADEKTNQIVIDYTYTPSRMIPAIRAADFVCGADTAASSPDEKISKTVAAYIRCPPGAALRAFFRLTRSLHKQHGFSFLVSTGPQTDWDNAADLDRHIRKMPGSEFCHYSSQDENKCAAQLEDFFARAASIIVSADTVSTLSDAINTAKPVFLLADAWVKRRLPEDLCNKNHRLQRRLIEQGRLKILTKRAILSDWKGNFYDEWREIGSRIAGIIRQRQMQIPALSRK